MDSKPLKAFISYKWEDIPHNQWVEKFATDLRAAGIDAILDRWEVRFGDSFTDYMTSKINEADVVLFIMTTCSVAAAEAPQGEGGAVKFEMQMATSRRIAGENMRLIGIYREGQHTAAHLRDHRYADFRDDSQFDQMIEELILDLLGRDKRPHLIKSITQDSVASIQTSISIDNGVFLNLEADTPYIDIGFFTSDQNLIISIDGVFISSFQLPHGRLQVDYVSDRQEVGIIKSPSFANSILRLIEIFGQPIAVEESRFDCIIRFNSGLFTTPAMKPFRFSEIDHDTHARTGRSRQVRPVAKRVAVNYSLAGDEELKLTKDNINVWSSKSLLDAKQVAIEIEVVADSSITRGFYHDALRLPLGTNLWHPEPGGIMPVATG